MTREKKGIVIGGGIGGLTAAILLAVQGISVTLLEQNETVGGKLQAVELGPYQFDFGPSTLTMPWIFDRILAEAGLTGEDGLDFRKLDLITRNQFPDGSTIYLSDDPHRMEEELRNFRKEDREGFVRFLQDTSRMLTIAESEFFSRSFCEWTDYLSPTLLYSMARVRPFQLMDRFHRRYFRDPRLVAMMNRYATYIGSSPYQTPATLSMIASMELSRGVYYIPGGNYRLVKALERAAHKVGVKIRTSCRVSQLEVQQNRIRGVHLEEGERLQADFIVSNVDYYTTQLMLGDGTSTTEQTARKDPIIPRDGRAFSSSGFLMLIGSRRPYPELSHHNLYYPDHYEKEFTDLFHKNRWPEEPAIYVCHSGATEPQRAAGGANLYTLVNVPPLLSEAPSYDEYMERLEKYGNRIIYRLEEQWGLSELSASVVERAQYGPKEIAARSGSYGGALYGQASHSLRDAFFRPSLQDPSVKGLFYAGGTVHPGGGTPMVALSGLLTAGLIGKRLRGNKL